MIIFNSLLTVRVSVELLHSYLYTLFLHKKYSGFLLSCQGFFLRRAHFYGSSFYRIIFSLLLGSGYSFPIELGYFGHIGVDLFSHVSDIRGSKFVGIFLPTFIPGVLSKYKYLCFIGYSIVICFNFKGFI